MATAEPVSLHIGAGVALRQMVGGSAHTACADTYTGELEQSPTAPLLVALHCTEHRLHMHMVWQAMPNCCQHTVSGVKHHVNSATGVAARCTAKSHANSTSPPTLPGHFSLQPNKQPIFSQQPLQNAPQEYKLMHKAGIARGHSQQQQGI